jgi:uncharacterized protein with HEPN domain
MLLKASSSMSSEVDRRIADAIIAARDNVALIREWGSTLDLSALRGDKKTRYAIERAFIALDSAIRDVPTSLLEAHGIPVNMIAGFRNILAHTYDDILDDRVILTIKDDLPVLDAALQSAMTAVRSA